VKEYEEMREEREQPQSQVYSVEALDQAIKQHQL